MTWPTAVEVHRQAVEWERRDVPAEIMFAIVQTESGGVPGLVSALPSGCAELPTDGGGKRSACNDLGLCQINPTTAVTYNAQGIKPAVTYDDLIGTDERAIRQQIRVGAWLAAWIAAKLHAIDPARWERQIDPRSADQCKLIFSAYAAGWGALKEKIDRLVAGGIKPSYAAISRSFPTWAGLKSAERKWAALVKYGTGGAAPGSKPLLASKGLPDWLPVALAMAGAWLLKRQAAKAIAAPAPAVNSEEEDQDEGEEFNLFPLSQEEIDDGEGAPA